MTEEILESIDELEEDKLKNEIIKISAFIDNAFYSKIINKLTDYAEIISEGKLSSFINFNFRLNSVQSESVVEFLISLGGLSRIFNIAQKGTKDLEVEYISNIFSQTDSLENITSFVSIRNILENRLSHQTQQYNINMSKNNTSLAMPINELRGHAKTFFELSKNNLSVSTKAQHGIIAASLHDAYITILNRNDFWQDRTYMKYFFNEDDQSKRNYYILSKKARFTLQGIQNRVAWSINELDKTRSLQVEETKNKEHLEETYVIESDEENNQFKRPDGSLDKMLLTPFGRQYGTRIDSVITDIFLDEEDFTFDENAFLDKIYPLFQRYSDFDSISHESGGLIVYLGDIILHHDITLKLFAEKYLYNNKSELFARFYTSNKEKIEAFILDLLAAYFEEKFRSIFRIIKSTEMKKFACAFIIKRIYLFKGDGLTQFGYFMIKTVARYGGILTQS